MKMKFWMDNNVREKLAQGFLFLSLSLAYSIILISGYIFITGRIAYPINWYASLKTFIYIGFVASGVTVLFFGLNSKNSKIALMVGIPYILLLILGIYAGAKPGSVIFLGLSLILIWSYSYEYIFKLINKFLSLKYASLLSIVLTVAIIFASFLLPKYLNYESDINISQINKLVKGKFDNSLTIEVENIDTDILYKNINSVEGSGMYKYLLPIILDKQKNGNVKVKGTVGSDLTWYCIFLRDNIENKNERIYNEDGSKNRISECRQNLLNESKNDFFTKRAYLQTQRTIGINTTKLFQNKIDEYQGNSKNISPDELSLLKVMLIRGYLFHHFNSILEGFDEGLNHSFFNQYGLGPISVISAIGKVLGTSGFDSLFISISVVNLIAFIGVLIFYRKSPFVFVAFAMSLLCVLFNSNYFAPFLYYIRYFPSFALILLLLNYENKFNNSSRWYLTLVAFVFFVIGLYNKEYAYFTVLTLFITYALTKNFNFIKFAFVVITGLSLAFIFSEKSYIEGANFAALLSGVGFDGSITLGFIVWVFFLVYLIYVVHRSVGFLKLSPILIFVFVYILLFSLKFVINSGVNHLGPLVLIEAIWIYHFSTKYNVNKTYAIYETFIAFFLVITISSLPHINFLKYTSRFDSVSYSKIKFSKLFLADSELIQKGESLNEFSGYKYNLISMQDDFLRIYTDRFLTSHLPNLSTNINFPIDYYHVLDMYEKSEYLVVDKSLLSEDVFNSLAQSVFNRDKLLNQYIGGYNTNSHIFKMLISDLSTKFNPIMGNAYFVLYKKNNL